MDLRSIIARAPASPFALREGIPWNDATFSKRMLREHLSQDHDRASRRSEVIERQVAWIHLAVLGGRSSRILDLGCGPGLYTSRLAQLGHECVGIDFAPASIEYARSQADRERLACRYELADLRGAELGTGFDAVLMLFGEFNTLAEPNARALLERAAASLAPDGRIVLEPHHPDYVRALGERGTSWLGALRGLFSERPHLLLCEARWHPEASATTERYFVVHEDGDIETYVQSTRAYSDAAFDAMADRAGLAIVGRYESLSGEHDGDPDEEALLYGLLLERAAAHRSP